MLATFALALTTFQAGPAVLTDYLVYGPFSSGGRTPCPTDPVAQTIVDGKWKRPEAGTETAGRPWQTAKAKEDGWLEGRALQGGYAFATYRSDASKTMVLDAAGHSMVYVNGVPRGGDVYGFGFVQLPIKVSKGENTFLFSVGRGRVRAALREVSSEVAVTDLDPTIPDLLVGNDDSLPASFVVSNPTDQKVKGLVWAVVDGSEGRQSVFEIGPMTVRKAVVYLPEKSFEEPGTHDLRVVFRSEGKDVQGPAFKVEVKPAHTLYKRTFVSRIDGSVQYYAVQPASTDDAKGLVLSLHGAGVEASGQAGAYGPKTWCDIVCPTNGRPFGFDWEDWGRTNALETLEDARAHLNPDADRVYLTGHSMGGHGTWSIGLLESDRFAAIAPCAGWCSFWSYAGAADWKEPDPVETLLRRAANASDTLKFIDNAEGLGVYVLHGAADDTVSVEEARSMRKALEPVKCAVDWHEEPGQGHWYDTDPEPGANCEDYRPLFDFFSRFRVPQALERRTVKFVAMGPEVGARKGFVRVLSQEKSLAPSRVEAQVWPDGSRISAKTDNVHAIAFEAKGMADAPEVELDGQKLSGRRFVKKSGQWAEGVQDGPCKDVSRPGGFKSAYDHGFRLVYLTGGKPVETAAARDKARFDAETWWYRGNGSTPVFGDDGLPATLPAGNYVFYGGFNALGTRRALFETKGFEVRPDSVRIGGKEFKGDLGLLLVRPNPAGGSVALVGGSSLRGFRTMERLSTFLAGVHYADFFLASPEMLTKGSKGVLATGWFGPDWSLGDDWASR
ncbi:MAG: prolyl oligopeptidase family serine peptidase [Armatimonadetes bacterium]|nr:prolyl oligopeptidase family serine peptidase [Armatimonadota bacterium]